MKKTILSTLCFLLVSCFMFFTDAGTRIVVLGSSTAAGAGVSDSNRAWVNQYRTYLQSIDPTNTVTNLAKGGYTTCAIMPTGTDPYDTGNHILEVDTERNITKALSLSPNAIIINMPTNDVSNGIPVATQMKHFATIIDLAKAAGVKVWITTSQPHNFGEKYDGPYSEEHQPNKDKQGARNKFKELTDSILNKYGEYALDFYTPIATEDGYSFIRPEYDSGDGVHLNDAAHDILFNIVKNANIPEIAGSTPVEISTTPIYINFGPAEAGLDSWNNVNNQASGYRVDMLNDSTGNATTVSIEITTGFTHAANNGSNSTIWDMNTAISTSNFSSNGENPVLTISGLNPTATYSFQTFGSRAGDGNRETTYTYAGENSGSATIDAASNTSSVATVKGIKPTAQGVVVLTIGKSSNNTSGFSYINAMRIVAEKGEPQPDVPEGVIRVDVAGTLSSLLPATTDTITTLILQGDLNSSDIKTIRELPSLKYLDMLNSKIVSGGEAYLNGMKTVENVFPKEMFLSNTVIETVILPKEAVEVAYHAFFLCSSVKKIVLPETIRRFGNDAFSGCTNLEEINMPAIAESLGTGVFYNCKKLTSISIPEGITILPGGTFYGCSTLESVTLPSTLEKIDGDWIFANCHALKAIAFPKTIQSISPGTFYDCRSLSTIECKSLTPPVTATGNGDTPFTGAFKPENCTLKVPFTSISVYKESNIYGVMNTIVPLANITADNEEVSPETTDLLATAKKITISGSTPDALEIQALFASNEKVTSIDMTGVIEYFEVPVAANPNCLVYAPASAQVENNNVVINGTAKKIVLTDAMPFEVPTAFHADAISYTRTIEESLTTNAQETTGWRGIVLPFDVSTIQARNKAGEQVELSAYNAEGEYDTSKNPFWLRELTTEGFAATQTFSANTPYIICFPNSSELDEHINIIGDVTFSASNAEITATPVFNAVEGKDFDMIATLQTVSAAEGIYAINNTGSSFVNNSRDIAPFECYVICKQGSTDAPDSFDLPAKLPTAIDNETVTGSKIYTADGNLVIISNKPTEIAVYNITGQMVLMQKVEAGKTIVNDIPHGVYIVNGQKIIL